LLQLKQGDVKHKNIKNITCLLVIGINSLSVFPTAWRPFILFLSGKTNVIIVVLRAHLFCTAFKTFLLVLKTQ